MMIEGIQITSSINNVSLSSFGSLDDQASEICCLVVKEESGSAADAVVSPSELGEVSCKEIPIDAYAHPRVKND